MNAVRLDPRFAEGHCLIADIFHSKKQYPFAEFWYRAALQCRRAPADAALGFEAWAYDEHPREQLQILRIRQVKKGQV